MSTKLSVLARLRTRVRHTRMFAYLRRQSPLNLATGGAILVLGAYTVFFILSALHNSLLFDGYAADGAFQALNPLRRLAAGEAIGADFNTFHGVGVSLLHLPFYYLFGQGLFASEFSRWLLSPLLFMLATYGFFYAFKRSWKIALVATAVITSVAMLVMSLFVLPFTSMLGVRSVMAVLVAIIMFNQVRLNRPLSKKYTWFTQYELLMSLALVACVLCGTEFGVAALLGFFVAHFLYKTDAVSTWKSRFLSSVRIGGMFLAFLLLALTVITGGHPLQPLQYAFGAIPADQFWYFGVPPNTFLYLGNIVSILSGDTSLHVLWLLALIAIIVTVRVSRLQVYRVYTQVFIYALLAGAFAMVSMLGYYHFSQAFALGRMSLLVIAAGGFVLWQHYTKGKKFDMAITAGRTKKRFTMRHIALFAALLFMVWSVVQTVSIGVGAVQSYDIKKILRKTKSYVLGKDTNILDEPWNRDVSALMPLIQSDNTVAVVDLNEDGFTHGINTEKRQIIVAAGEHASFMRPGQIVYFNKAGRQFIGSVAKRGDKQVITLQNGSTILSPQYDGSAHPLIVAEDFKHDNNKLWSTYSTMFEVEMGTFNPNSQHADYIIHALGPELRQQYVNDFNKVQPEYVITLKKSYFIYEEWLQNASWDFYSLVDKNYEAVRDGTMHVLWKRKDQPWVNPLAQNSNWQNLDVTDNGERITIPSIDFAKLPDVNAYINDMRTKEAEHNQQNGGTSNEKPSLLLPRDEYIQALGEQQVAQFEKDQPKFEGQGFNTSNNAHQTDQVENHGNDGSKIEKDKQSDDEQDSEETKPRGGDLLQPRRAVVLIKLKYETKNPLDKLPLIGKTARFFVQPNNLYNRTPVSLAPYKNEVVFPIVVSELNHDSFLSLKNYSLLPVQTSTKIISAQWQLLDTSAANLKTLTDFPGPSLKRP